MLRVYMSFPMGKDVDALEDGHDKIWKVGVAKIQWTKLKPAEQ